MQCDRENDVVKAITSGQLPQSFHPELRTHVQSCRVCSEVASVAVAIRDDYAEAACNVRLPSASLVWWRAELRLRRDSIRAVERPLTAIQALGGAAAIGVLLALLVRLSAALRETFQPLLAWTSDAPATLIQQNWLAVLALGAVLILAPLALYLMLSDR